MWRKLAHFISIGNCYLKNTRILLGGIGPGKILLHGACDKRLPALFAVVFLARSDDGSEERIRIKVGEHEAISLNSVEVDYGVRQTSRTPHNRNSTVAHRLHLHKPGRLKTRRNEYGIGAGENESWQNIVKKVMPAKTARVFLLKFLKKEPVFIVTTAHDYHLKINIVEKRLRNLHQQVKSFLLV